jgi:hypothetical protein
MSADETAGDRPAFIRGKAEDHHVGPIPGTDLPAQEPPYPADHPALFPAGRSQLE